MSQKLIYLFVFCLFACRGVVPQESQRIAFPGTGDSGLVAWKAGMPFLVSAHLIDTGCNWGEAKHDTVPLMKYYRMAGSDNYLACLYDLGEGTFGRWLLFEVTPAGKVLQRQYFYHGNYGGCGDGFGFGRVDHLFYLRICGTGSAFSAAYLYLFQQLAGAEEQESITESIWQSIPGRGEQYEYLSGSVVSARPDTVVIAYSWETGKNYRDTVLRKVMEQKVFRMVYVKENSHWKATDSAAITAYFHE
ncbi:hypothetical protein ECE50_015730 [Chitinophaga sp. Mgbs1]|uniref:Uncharacterized protein n=1 Tax=Chitinophaga solisilvae TaxID=1233460 RepID=A0A3S1DTG3_9BACT|nr:hypothetical protein [Chitinophaga solisilvae]